MHFLNQTDWKFLNAGHESLLALLLIPRYGHLYWFVSICNMTNIGENFPFSIVWRPLKFYVILFVCVFRTPLFLYAQSNAQFRNTFHQVS